MSRQQKHKSQSHKQQMEQLEDRQLMALINASLLPIGEIQIIPPTPLVVDGTSLADNIYISQDTSGNLVVNNNGVITSRAAWTVSKVVVQGGGGNDYLYAYPNVTRVIEANGGDGNDWIYGGAAADNLSGGGGNDYMVGNDGNDSMNGALANSIYYYDHTGNDSLWGMNGDDVLYASSYGNCRLDGGAGADSIYGYNGMDNASGGAGADYVSGGLGNDVISGGSENDILYAGAGDDVVHGDAGNDWMGGDDGNDKMYADAGDDVMAGGNGDDVMVSIGGGQYDMIGGNAGYDSFWCDAETTEKVLDADYWEMANGHVHRVASFRGYHYNSGTTISVSRELVGQNLAEPVNGGDYLRNFSDKPLFASNGPSKDDIDQGDMGDCYFLATLSAIAKVNPDRVRQSVVELGDRTYAVRFFSGSSEQYVRVDGDLPTWSAAGSPRFAGLGTQSSVWTAIIEKAWAFYRENDSDWNSIAAGWMDEVFGAMGVSTDTLDVSWWYKLWNNSDDLWNYVNGQVNAGKAVTVGTHGDATTIVGTHAYMVESTYIAADGSKHIVLRNPWGHNPGSSNAYIDITAGQLFNDIAKVQSAYV